MLDASSAPNLLDGSGPSLPEWLEQVARELVVVAGAIGSTIWLWDEHEQALQIVASCRMSADYVAYGNQVAHTAESRAKAPVYMAYRTGSYLEVESPATAPEYRFFTEGFEDLQVGFIVAGPIGMMHRRVGALALYYQDVAPLSEVQHMRVQLIATQIAGMAIQQELRSQLGVKIEELAGANTYLVHANEEMKQLDRLKGEFMSAVSHELRTPLTSILGYMELLEDEVGGTLSPQQREFVRRVQDASQTLVGLVDNVLDYMQLEAGTFGLSWQDTDMRELVEQAVARVRPQVAVAGLRLTMTLPAAPLIAQVDFKRMSQVVLNLLSNAIAFTPAGGAIMVTLRQAARGLEIEVADTGLGIAPEHQGKIFGKFYQVDAGHARRHGGVGLGLAIVQACVEAHGGTVLVQSQLEAGSAFVVRLPLDAPR